MLITIGIAVALLSVKGFSDWQTVKTVKGESISLPTQLIVDKFEEMSQNVLGKTAEILPEKESQTTQTVQTETTKIIENQTKEIIEIIKQLPQNQVDQIKKQIFKDFCQEILGE